MRTKTFEQYEQEKRVQNRIACEELGYGIGEARFTSVQEWEQHWHREWLPMLRFMWRQECLSNQLSS